MPCSVKNAFLFLEMFDFENQNSYKWIIVRTIIGKEEGVSITDSAALEGRSSRPAVK